MRSLSVLCLALAGGVQGSAVELNAGNFDTNVKTSGKNAFIKFLAPW
jgi:hypothetical protein